jgi:hypothetical protein
LHLIEQFTLILIIKGQIHECRWDGSLKIIKSLDNKPPQIWSSATLYDLSASTMRQSLFNNFIASDEPKTSKGVIRFHRTAGKEDLINGVMINRKSGIRTKSITHVRATPLKMMMTYIDLADNTEYNNELIIVPQLQSSETSDNPVFMALRRLWIRIFNWEYWPFKLVYGPIIFYWFWLSLKSKSLFFFNTSNPNIENGGFAMESKKKIYDLIPQGYYPKTQFFKAGTSYSEVQNELSESALNYPLIAKPDIGGRGVQVKLVYCATELSRYVQQIKVDFLIQEFVSYQKELGIFYYRMPGEDTGHISGIVGKRFLAVTGDGESTIKTLLIKEPRYLLQLPSLMQTESERLKIVLPLGEKLTLVPYGNHARGAEFIDLSHLITTQLSETMDKVCQQIPGFYFGRLDVMYNDWEKLKNGQEFQIIELNGAGSEPTHIYDPSHSIFFAWKEIIRHWNLLYKISKMNRKIKGLKPMSYKEGVAMLKGNAAYEKLVA